MKPSRVTRTILDARVVTGAGGGIEKTLVTGAVHHEAAGYRSVLAFVHPVHDEKFRILRRRALDAGVELHDRAEWGPVSPLTLAWFASLCRTRKIDIWHGHDYKSNVIGLLLQPMFGFALVSTMHGWVQDTPRTRLYFSIDRRALLRYSQVVAVSTDLMTQARRLGVQSSRLTLIENGIDTDHFRRSQSPNARADTIRIGAAGRLSPEKGFLLLIEAVESLRDAGLPVSLEIAGDGDQRATLLARIAASPHASAMRLSGYLEDLRAFFEQINIFCISSVREGLPNVALEAMAMEVPIVATDAGGLATFLNHKVDSMVCRAGSAAELGSVLQRVIEDPAVAAALAVNARRRVVSECSFENRMQRLFEVYDRLG